MAGNEVIAGRPPAAQDEGLDEAIKDLAPHLALARVDSLARFIFSNVAVIGTLLGALGLIGADEARMAPREVLGIPLVVLLVGLSLVLAVVAITPWLFRVNPRDRTAVRRSYGRRIRVRGSAAMLAALLFGGALVAAVDGAAVPAVTTNLTGQVSGSGADAKATMTAEITGLVADATANATLTEVSAGRRRDVLCRSVSTGDRTGKATMGCTVGSTGSFGAIRASVSVVDQDDELASERLDITP